jgi:AraC family transcriptional regulator, alkane utilization regulator
MDKISTLLARYSFNARIFFKDDPCKPHGIGEERPLGHLHLVRKGPVIFSHDHGEALHVDEPAMVFYPRGMRHALEVPADGRASLSCAMIAFDKGHADPLAGVLPDCMRIPLGESCPIRHTLDLLFVEAARDGPGREVILERLCDVLMTQVIRHELDAGRICAGILPGLADAQLAPVLAAIHARPHEPWQLRSLAALACMSRASFSEHFKARIGLPPIEYLTRRRIALACKLLRKGQPVKGVSTRAGYTSPAAFTRAFKKQMGLSPGLWLKNEIKEEK